MNFGLNLYSIKTLIQTEQDFINTCQKLKEMGYEVLQFSGATFDAEKIKRVSDEVGIKFVLTHVSEDRILNDTNKLMEEHALFGCKNIGLGALSVSDYTNDDNFIKKVELLNKSAELMAKNGFKFFYHNHHTETTRLSSGEMKLDYMIKNAPYINFTLDTYWLQYGGLNPIEVFKKLKGRIECVHLKDYRTIFSEDWFKPQFAPCGHGNLDMPKIIETGLECGTKYFLVEQDDASTYENPLEEVKKSIDYLKSLKV